MLFWSDAAISCYKCISSRNPSKPNQTIQACADPFNRTLNLPHRVECEDKHFCIKIIGQVGQFGGKFYGGFMNLKNEFFNLLQLVNSAKLWSEIVMNTHEKTVVFWFITTIKEFVDASARAIKIIVITVGHWGEWHFLFCWLFWFFVNPFRHFGSENLQTEWDEFL